MSNKKPEGTIGAAVILPSIYGLDYNNGTVTNNDTVPDMEEIGMRLEAKRMLCTFFNDRKMDVSDMIASLVPIVLEIAIEHCLAERFDEAMGEFEKVFQFYMDGVKSDTIKEVVRQIISAKKNHLDWS